MRRSISRLAAPLLLALIATSVGAQTYTVGDTLTVIQRPLLNIPSIVRPGDPLPISCDADPATTGWTATLEFGDLAVPLTIDGASYDPATLWWTLEVVTPQVPLFELYDLRVTADGLDDTTRDAVKVIPEFRDTFEVIHITDPHLPTYLYYYQDGADTDSTTSVNLRAITHDVNLINPEFVLLTGDLIHEGELEDFLDKRYYSRSQMHLNEFEVPVYLTAGNHDIGGWDDTPPSDGTARRDWWRFYGWKRLDNPPPGAPSRTQDYSFDYGTIHFTGLEAYDNYDGWRYAIYGPESFTSAQMAWLQADMAAAGDALRRVLFHHYDFDNELNLSALGIDLSLSGHIHSSNEDHTYPLDVVTDNAGGVNRPFRLVRFDGADIDPRPAISAQDPDRLRVTHQPDDSGTHDLVTVRLINGHGEDFHHALLKIAMPLADEYTVTGGTLTQVDATGDPAICYVELFAAAASVSTVQVEAVHGIGAELPAADAIGLTVQPNPFNPRTVVSFSLPRAGVCRVSVFDVQGRVLAVLNNGWLESGRHEVVWDGRDAAGRGMPSGTYLLGLQAGRYAETRKAVLVR